MKKILSLILCIGIVLAPTYIYASDFPEETLITMGDVNSDGSVTASDARTALRISAGLEKSDNINMLSIDTDANGLITASDARNILRYSASLSNFSTGFDGTGGANALKTLKNGRYTIHAESEEVNFTMAIDGKNIYLETSDFSFSFVENSNAAQIWENMGVMYLDGDFYVTFTINGKNCAWLFTEDAIKMLESSGDASFSVDEIFETADIISNLLPEKFTAPEEFTLNGETMFKYKSVDNSSEFIMDSKGCLKQINACNSNGKVTSSIDIESFSSGVASRYFDLSRFDEIQLF